MSGALLLPGKPVLAKEGPHEPGGVDAVARGPDEPFRQRLATGPGVASSLDGIEHHRRVGRAYQPRTSPPSFQALGRTGLALLAEARAETGLPIVTELTDLREIDAVLEVADVIQIGARN